MIEINSLGKILVLFGIMLIVIGGALLAAGKVPWFGRLPGDLLIQKKNFTLFFPITTSILVSIVLTITLYFLGRK